MQKITPCLWCDDQAEQAVAFYTEIFKNSRIVIIARYGDFGHEVYGKAAGTIMAIAFSTAARRSTSKGISLHVNCETQQEVDYYWEKLSERGDKKAQ